MWDRFADWKTRKKCNKIKLLVNTIMIHFMKSIHRELFSIHAQYYLKALGISNDPREALLLKAGIKRENLPSNVCDVPLLDKKGKDFRFTLKTIHRQRYIEKL